MKKTVFFPVSVELGELKSVRLALRLMFPQHFSFSQIPFAFLFENFKARDFDRVTVDDGAAPVISPA